MKILISSVGFQAPDGTLLANGSIVLTLPAGVYEILSGGGQVYGSTLILNLDANGKVTGSPQVWGGDELNGHPIYAVQLCTQPSGLGGVASAQWDIAGAGPIDLSLIVTTNTGVGFPAPVLQNPTAQQNINGQTLNMEGAPLGFSAAGSVTADSFLSRLAAGVIAVGTAIGNALGTLRTAILQIGGADTGLSRAAAGVIDVGNGTQGDASGSLNLAAVNKVAITPPATGATLIIADGTTQTFPSTSQTLVGRSSTDALTGKTLTGPTTGNNVSVLNAQGSVGPLTGNSTDQVIYTFTLPANTIDTTSKGIRISCAATHNSGTANPSCKINLNGVNVVNGAIGTSGGQSVAFQATILRTGPTTGESMGFNTSTGALLPFSITLAGLAWTSAQIITFTFNAASPDQMTGRNFLIEQIQ